jgi:hypothetical protein
MIYQVELHGHKYGKLVYISYLISAKNESKAICSGSELAIHNGFTNVRNIRTTEYEQPSELSPF